MLLQPIKELAKLIPDIGKFYEINPPTREVPRPPDFFFGSPRNGVLSNYFRRYEWIHEQGVWFIRSCYVRHPYIVQKNESFISFPIANIHPAHLDPIIQNDKKFFLKTTELPTPYVLLAGPGYHIFGHWIADFLPKLYTLEASGFELRNLSFILPSDAPSFAKKILSIFEISESQICYLNPSEQIEVDLLVPTTSHNGVRGQNFGEVSAFLKRYLPVPSGDTNKHPFKNIFVCRPPGNRSCRNRDIIERIAADLGYSMIRPEQLPLLDQLYLFGGARVIIGEYGSALHLSLFSDAGTVVCGLRGSNPHPGFIQSAIGRGLRQPTGYVFGQSESDDPSAVFTIAEDAARDCFQWLLNANRFPP